MPILPVRLRPHHFLCLKGYKGLNYNAHQIGVWDNVVKVLKQNPQTEIVIGKGKDSLCSTCPMSVGKNGFIGCIEKNISELDKKVKALLGLKTGETRKYSDVVEIMNKKVTKAKHEELCSRCFWWQKGLCRDSFEKQTTHPN